MKTLKKRRKGKVMTAPRHAAGAALLQTRGRPESQTRVPGTLSHVRRGQREKGRGEGAAGAAARRPKGQNGWVPI